MAVLSLNPDDWGTSTRRGSSRDLKESLDASGLPPTMADRALADRLLPGRPLPRLEGEPVVAAGAMDRDGDHGRTVPDLRGRRRRKPFAADDVRPCETRSPGLDRAATDHLGDDPDQIVA